MLTQLIVMGMGIPKQEVRIQHLVLYHYTVLSQIIETISGSSMRYSFREPLKEMPSSYYGYILGSTGELVAMSMPH